MTPRSCRAGKGQSDAHPAATRRAYGRRHSCWIATSRFDLTVGQIALIYKLRWQIETFFAWWKRHFKVYHLISRSRHGLMIQMLAGLITYILLAISCQEQHGEAVSIRRVRQLRNQILNGSRMERSDPAMQEPSNPEIIHASP